MTSSKYREFKERGVFCRKLPLFAVFEIDERDGLERMTWSEQLEQIYGAERQRLFRSAYVVTSRSDLAEDAVHEAFARLLRAPRCTQDLKAYVFRAVRNAAFDLSTSKLAREQPRDEFPDPGAGPLESLESTDHAESLRALVESLRPKERDVVLLRLWADLSFREISDVLDSPSGTVSALYYRAIDRLRSAVETRRNL
ncbi:MAG: sigma-70 family RNA polymerase sigma factor [Planctomycetota bacterium]